MNNRSATRRATSLLVLLAMLIVSVAALLPITASADPGDPIQNFSVQALNDLDLRDDDETDLRFVFKITNLDYEKVGIIISKTVATPTYGAEHCYTKEVTTVYNTINVSGTPEDAGENLWWVAIKLTNVPHEYFDGALYVRAFVKNADQDPTYSDVALSTVCKAGGHETHLQAWDAEGTATLLSAGNLTGTCPVCGLEASFTGVTRDPVVFDSKHVDTRGMESPLLAPQNNNRLILNKTFKLSKSVADIADGDHFHPDTYGVAAQGKDLWFEYSFLLSSSFWNYNVFSSEVKIASFRKPAGGNPGDDYFKDFYYLYSRDAAKPTDCPYKGHFDFSSYYPNSTSCVHDFGGPVYLAGYAAWNPQPVRGDSPYLWDAVSQTTYGWHRIGFRFHQEVASVAGSTVTYTGYSELYVDGTKVWEVGTNMQGNPEKSLKENNVLLWTATAEGGVITGYEDNSAMLVEMYYGNVMDSSNAVTVGVGDVFWTCGNGGFVQSVSANVPDTGNELTNFFYTIN